MWLSMKKEGVSRSTDAHVVAADGCAVIVPALSVSIFFDALSPDLLEGIKGAWRVIEPLVAPHLNWYMTDSMAERALLPRDVFAHLPATLEQIATTRPYFAFRAHGGPDMNCLDPWALDVWVDKPRQIGAQERALLSAIFKVPDASVDRVANCLRVSMPASAGAAALEQLVSQLMEHMDLLHGNAGFALLFDDALPGFEREHWAALARIAMRHPGYDLLHYPAVRACVADKIKTVNWLTLLGPELSKAVDLARLAAKTDQTITTSARGTVCIKAAPEPTIGDVNHGDRLPAYRAVAKLLSAISCSSQLEFGAAFDDDLTQRWVERFEGD
jgi:hypothetical protein